MSAEESLHTTQHNASDTIVMEIQNLHKRYGKDGPVAVNDISLNVREREFILIVGPSICNLLEPSSGQVILHGRQVTVPPPKMVLVSQDYSRSPVPWLDVSGNVRFPLKKEKSVDRVEKEQRAREELEDLVLWLRGRFGITVLLVTHDIDEAVYLSARIFVLSSPPSVVVKEVPVELPRPREQTATCSDPEFLRIRNEIHGLITKRPMKNKSEPAPSAVPDVEEKGV